MHPTVAHLPGASVRPGTRRPAARRIRLTPPSGPGYTPAVAFEARCADPLGPDVRAEYEAFQRVLKKAKARSQVDRKTSGGAQGPRSEIGAIGSFAVGSIEACLPTRSRRSTEGRP